MRLVLWNPPGPTGCTLNREGFGGLGVLVPTPRGFVYPSLRLAQVAGEARVRGLKPRVLDEVVAPRRGRWQRGALYRADLVIAVIARASLESDLDALATLRARGFSGRLVVTGVALAEHALAVQHAVRGSLVHEGPGGYGALSLGLGETLRDTPFADCVAPDWSRVPLGRSRRPGLQLSRGCTHGCTYCPYVTATGRRLEVRDPEAVAVEFLELERTVRPKRIVFRDPTFGLDRQATMELLERLIQAGGRRTPFEVETRPEVLDHSMIELLARAGVAEVKLGLESMEASALVANGRIDAATSALAYRTAAEAALAGLAEKGIFTRGFYLDGLSGAADGAAVLLDTAPTALVRKHVLAPEILGGGVA